MAIMRNLPKEDIKKIARQIEELLLKASEKNWSWEINYSEGTKKVIDEKGYIGYNPNDTATLTLLINGGCKTED
jgi:hypothetical protein